MNNPKALIPFIILLLALTYAYAWALATLPSFDQASWISIALFNSVVAAIIVAFWKPKALPPAPLAQQRAAWAMGPLVLLGTALICLLSLPGEDPAASSYPYTIFEIIGLCLWVPIVEEIIFRRFLTHWLGQKFAGLSTIYLSSLLFALAHTNPLTSPWPPLGPFLLGLAAAWCYRASGRILAPIMLHAACNASAVLFTLYAPSWLELLGGLYQKL